MDGDEDEELSPQDLMDFSPVYRCMHICTVLKEDETFKAHHRQQRQQQARLVVQPPINMVISNFKKITKYIKIISNLLLSQKNYKKT